MLYNILVEDLLRCILQIRSSHPVDGAKNLIVMDEAHLLLSGSSSIQEKGNEYILPIRIDDTELPGLPPTIGCLRLKDYGIDK